MSVPLKLEPTSVVVDPCAALMADEAKLSRMAMEFARDLVPAPQILAAYNVTQDDFNNVIVHSASFKRYFAEYQAIWNSETSTQLRFAMKAGALVEDWLTEAHAILHDRQQPLSAKVELAKKLMDVAGFTDVHGPKGQSGPAQSSVTINLGHGRERIVITKDKIDIDHLGEPSKDITSDVIDMTPLPVQVNTTPPPLPDQNSFPTRKVP